MQLHPTTGAEVDAVDRHFRTPLHIAARYGQAEAIRVLIEQGVLARAVYSSATN